MSRLSNALNTKSIQISITAAILFLVVASPFLFDQVDRLFSMILGTRYGSNGNLVLVVHAVVFGLLMYFANQYFFSDLYRLVAKNV
jgi:hypothetical protein